MDYLKLGAVEARFAEIVWKNEPVTTNQLTKICAEILDWKRTTTYTVLKKLSDKGLFKVENSVVTSQISKKDFNAIKSVQFVEETFQGSLTAFLVALSTRKKLTDSEIEELQEVVNSMRS